MVNGKVGQSMSRDPACLAAAMLPSPSLREWLGFSEYQMRNKKILFAILSEFFVPTLLLSGTS